jgi:hypothetical protein
MPRRELSPVLASAAGGSSASRSQAAADVKPAMEAEKASRTKRPALAMAFPGLAKALFAGAMAARLPRAACSVVVPAALVALELWLPSPHPPMAIAATASTRATRRRNRSPTRVIPSRPSLSKGASDDRAYRQWPTLPLGVDDCLIDPARVWRLRGATPAVARGWHRRPRRSPPPTAAVRSRKPARRR